MLPLRFVARKRMQSHILQTDRGIILLCQVVDAVNALKERADGDVELFLFVRWWML